MDATTESMPQFSFSYQTNNQEFIQKSNVNDNNNNNHVNMPSIDESQLISSSHQQHQQPMQQQLEMKKKLEVVTKALDEERIEEIEKYSFLSVDEFKSSHCSSCPVDGCNGYYFTAIAKNVWNEDECDISDFFQGGGMNEMNNKIYTSDERNEAMEAWIACYESD